MSASLIAQKVGSLENSLANSTAANSTAVNPAPAFKSVLEYFLAQVDVAPDAVALDAVAPVDPSITLTAPKTTLTYRQLNQKANQLAHFLKQQGITASSLIAIQLARSPNAILAFLSVLKLRAAYVPIDPNYPTERREYSLQDSGAAALLTTASNGSSPVSYTGSVILSAASWLLGDLPRPLRKGGIGVYR